MNQISGGANFVPHQNFVSNAQQAGGLHAQMKGLVKSGDDEEVAHQQGEQAQLSRLAQQQIEQSKQQQEGRGADNAHQSGADAEIMDDLQRDGSEENDIKEKNRQAELGKSKDGRGVAPGGQAGLQTQGGDGVVHEENLELGEIGRQPDEVLADVPGHAAAFAKGNVEAQLANPGQVDKLTEIKALPPEQQVQADSPELQPVTTLGPVLGDQETGEVTHPSPQTEGRAPTNVPHEFDAEQMAHMERVVAEQELARQQSGEGEMMLAGGGSVGGNGAVDAKPDLKANYAQERAELLQSADALNQYGWDGLRSQLLYQAGGNEQVAAGQFRNHLVTALNNTNPEIAQFYRDSANHADGFKNYVDRTKAYIAEHGHKFSPEDVDAASKMLDCADKCNDFVGAGEALKAAGQKPPTPQEMAALNEKLFGSVGQANSSFQSEFKGEMNKLAEAGKLNEHNIGQAAGAVSANVAAKQLNSMDRSNLFSPPGQTEEEEKAAQEKALAQKKKWDQEEVDGDLSDAMAFQQQSWTAQRMQNQPSPELAAYQAKINDYVNLQTVMRQGYSLSTGNPDSYNKSAYNLS